MTVQTVVNVWGTMIFCSLDWQIKKPENDK